MSDYEKCISSDSESEDEPLIPEPKLQKPKRQYNIKPMSDEAKDVHVAGLAALAAGIAWLR